MSTLHYASECAFEVDPAFVDKTNYVYLRGDVRVVIEPFGAAATARDRVDTALAMFARSFPRHAVLERRSVETPVRGELVVHRMQGDEQEQVEVMVYWAIGDRAWICRTNGPVETEDACRKSVEGFLDTYQPTGEP